MLHGYRTNGVLTWLLGDPLPFQGASRGRTTITANADGTLASEQTYTACPRRGCSAALREGTTRSGSVSTDRQYTGQISEPQLGIYFYSARYYDPYLNRFLSPDSIIPDPYNPLDWDRYSYVRNNPVQYTDPTGHNICDGPLGAKECADAGGNAEYYDYLVEKVFEPYPEPEDLYNSDWNTLDRIEGVLSNYEKVRRALFLLYGWEAIDKSGKIRDDLFITITGTAEFGSMAYDPEAYNESIEALSNQYFSERKNPGPMQCRGNCTLSQQLLWATQMEAWYGIEDFTGQFISSGAWKDHLTIGFYVTRGFMYGTDSSWFWGNVDEAGLSKYVIVVKRLTYSYPLKPYFIIYSGED